jgi:hypothetical protein
MRFTRIRMFETYMRRADGSWDFSLLDRAYRAAAKYGVGIWGNFFAATSYEDVGGFKFPRSQAHLDSIAEYIKQVVLHFKAYPSHAGWALLNEIGSGKVPATELLQKHINLFANSKPLAPMVHLVYTRPSLWVEQKMQMGGPPVEGKQPGGVMKSLLGYYETLLEMGVPASISAWEEFDFSQKDYTGKIRVLAHQVSLPASAVELLAHFEKQGGTLIADGLTRAALLRAHPSGYNLSFWLQGLNTIWLVGGGGLGVGQKKLAAPNWMMAK